MATSAPAGGLRGISLRAMLFMLAARQRGYGETREHEERQARAEAALSALVEICPATDEELVERLQSERRFTD
jgi:hypothetical protein